MTTIGDAQERARAIDPTHSFCVSAPAGSGKTELLIQRYLALLARVQRPEQVVAITFTRKAAAEMRERIIGALAAAERGTAVQSEHEQVTRDLALAALAAEKRGGWQLRSNFSRLNIRTIDGFCRGLVNQMPIVSTFGGQATPTDDATELYEEAVQTVFELLDHSPTVAADLRPLLLHFDNNWEKLQTLLVTMLARREQWRDYIGVHHSPAESEEYLIHAVEEVIDAQLETLEHLLGSHTAELGELLQFAATNLDEAVPNAFPQALASELSHWRLLRSMLLTADGNWRKTITKTSGFPADKGEAAERKAQLKSLLAVLSTDAALAEQLHRIAVLPEIESGEDSWQLVLHLSRLLPVLGAQLLLVFERRATVDHGQIAESALLALGSDDEPTELALRLDYSIEHLLVDEFQDTAISQYLLLQKLTRGWGEHNAADPQSPRTLMIVGDAMQSIYGFRDANVGLFIKAANEGFNGVELERLQLSSNFRSDPSLVEWVNTTFTAAFPDADDMYKARIRYRKAEPVVSPMESPQITLQAFYGDSAREAEQSFVCARIRECLDAGSNEVAILGRGRKHLQPIARRLRELNIDYYAPDLDTLADSPLVADLLNLCAALANSADRLAWLALLRAPWTGLTLRDLLVIAGEDETVDARSVRARLELPEVVSCLTDDGQTRVAALLHVLRWAEGKRDRLALRAWVEQTWTMLGGPACATTQTDLEDAESFLQLLEPAAGEGNALDIEWLTRQTRERYMSGGDPDSQVQLMTLHKAKGLEFDSVIIPRMAAPPRSDSRAILLWDDFTTRAGNRAFLLAADDQQDKGPTLYNFLREQRKQKSLQENTRVLYVGATRAKRQLILTATLRWSDKQGDVEPPATSSLLSPIWDTFKSQATIAPADASPSEDLPSNNRRLQRLMAQNLHTPQAASEAVAASNPPPYTDNFIDRCIGTVVHLALETLAELPELPVEAPQTHLELWKMTLAQSGLHGQTLASALQRVETSVESCLRQGSKGRWILSPQHAGAHTEWALTCSENGIPCNIVIDRTFVERDSGIRWLVDYKNSEPEPGESVAAFTAREGAHYLEQLTRYGRALSQFGDEPVRAALYFTALDLWHPVDIPP